LTVRVTKSAVAGGASLLFFACVGAPRTSVATAGQSPSLELAPAPPSYTFEMDVEMAMRHFPWLHFRMSGTGEYDPGESYAVHFAKLPWFAPRQQHDCDLSMLDPVMWPTRFSYQEIGEERGETLYSLHALDDPTLKDATVTLGPYLHARQVDATYTDGTQIRMSVNSSSIDGFLLPATITAEIDEPHITLSANADFKDYDFSATPEIRNSSP
jgi:hypothetical protein